MLSFFVVAGVAVTVVGSLKAKVFISEAASSCPQECPIGDDFP